MEDFNENEYKRGFELRRWKGLIPFVRPYARTFLIVLITICVISFVDIIMPLFQGYAIDSFVRAGTVEGLLPFTAVYFIVVTLQCALVVVFTRASMRLEMFVGRDLKQAQFRHLQTLSLSYYNRTSVGYMVARVMSDSGRISGMLAWGLVDALWALVYIVGVFISMLLLDARLALPVLCVVPAIVLLTVLFQGKILIANRRIRHINSRITGSYNEGITGADTSKTLGIEKENLGDFKKITEQMRSQSVRAARLNGVYIPAVVFCGYMAAAIVLLRGGSMAGTGEIRLGTLSAFTTYAIGIFEPIQQLARVIANILGLQVNLERVETLLSTEPDITDTKAVEEKYGDVFEPKKDRYERITGDIEFKDVSFRYPDGGDWILRHFELKIPAGTTVAIVGDTGAGKSTLVNLACRFFEPTEGEVLIDGEDYRTRSQHWLHSSLGYVLQEPHLFTGTIKDNIRYGNPGATDDEVRAAAEAVGADRIAARLPQGYDTQVGEGGGNLSGGERQLVSFARAVLADPRIFVLDEATSSVDTESEELIAAATTRLLDGRTSFLIAHRLSSIRRADIILVVRAGKIIERGTHESLLAADGEYASLYRRQFEDERAGAVLKK